MEALLIGARLMLAGAFATAGAAKLADRRGTRRSLEAFGVPASATATAAVLLPAAELATAAALIPETTARWGAAAALVLLLVFIAAIANALAHGESPECNCFGNVHSAPAGKGTIARNVVLALPAVYVVADGPGPAFHAWLGERDAEVVATVAVLAAMALAVAVARLWVSNRELDRSLNEAYSELSRVPPGLPVGASAPRFSDTDATGAERSLKSLLAPGRPAILVFAAAGCDACEQLMPLVDQWREMLADQLTVAVVEDQDVLKLYRVSGTPSAVAVTPDERIASVPADGPLAIEALVRLTLRAEVVQVAPAVPGTAR